jgi:hypothetical protein
MSEIIELTKQDVDMDGFQFVCRAVPCDQTGYCHHECIKIEDGNVVGMDGRRIHMYRHKEAYRPGVYRVLKALKKHIVLKKEKEEDYKKPFPPYTELFTKWWTAASFEASLPNNDAGIASGFARIIRCLKSYHCINPAFLKDLDDVFEVCVQDDKPGVFFSNLEGKKAVIMTMALEDE